MIPSANPIGFNANDSTLTFILKVRDAFELLTERMASMESILMAHRNETNEGLFALRDEVNELRHLVNAKFNDDEEAQNLLQSASQTFLNEDVDNLLALPICSPSIKIDKPAETHLTESEPKEQQEIEEPIYEESSSEESSDEEQTEITPTQTEPEEQSTNEDFKDAEADFIDSKAHLSARRPRDDEVVVETPSTFFNNAPSEIGDRSDIDETESQISVCQSEVTVDLPVRYDHDLDLDERSLADLDETPVQHTDTVVHETSLLVEKQVAEPVVKETRSCSGCELPLTKCECVTDEEEDDLVSVFQRNKISSNTDLSSEATAFLSASSSPLPPFYSANTSEVSEQNVSVFQDKPSESKAVEKTVKEAAEEAVEQTINKTADNTAEETISQAVNQTINQTVESEKSQSREVSPNTSFGNNSTIPAKPIFGRPMFGAAHRTFGSFATENPAFLKKLDPNENPFAVDPSKNKIFHSPSNNNSDKPSASSTVSPSSLNTATAPSKLVVGLAPGVTGEESEIVWLETRCRIYQFFKKDDIRERGVGKLRLLEDPIDRKLRCVMRREQVQKVCANFKITPKFTVATNNNGKQILTWSCLDFSDPEKTSGEPTTFICKFENEETANLFKKLTQTYSAN
ncbi:Nuclear Pore complex Protein [Aphelenchoides bicaudatus]|nr:Nuclear Pore complex Protein [Aphelenchoides bicaudatus]